MGLVRSQKPDIIRSYRLINAMYDEARRLGAFPLKDPLEGLDVDIRMAKAVNFVRRDTGKDSE